MITKLKPMAHQQQVFDWAQGRDYGALFCEMGTGKTKIVLDIIQNDATNGALVTAPNGLHRNWDKIEIPKHVAKESHVYCWKGNPTTNTAKKLLERLFLSIEDTPNVLHFFLINVEALRTEAGFKWAKRFQAAIGNHHFVVDESTCIKNPKAQVTKKVIELARDANRRWALNGTPITQGPLDLYSQCKFLSSESIPYKSFTAFKNTFAQEQLMTMQNRSFRKIVGYKNIDRLTREIDPFSVHLQKKDCLDLPEKTFQTRYVEMTKQQEDAYRDMKNLCLAQLESGEISSVTMALTKLLRLHQITTGFFTSDEGVVTALPNHRTEALLDIAEQSRKLVIFCAYRENVEQATRALAKAHGDKCVVTFTGGDSGDERTSAVQRFQEDDECRFFIGTSAAAKGLTLHAASTMVYFSCNYSLEVRLQSQDRIHRIGQKNACTYIDLVAYGTVDQAILEALKNKKEIAKSVLDDLTPLFK